MVHIHFYLQTIENNWPYQCAVKSAKFKTAKTDNEIDIKVRHLLADAVHK